MKQFNKGDRVSYTYKHYLNSKSYTLITKMGTFIRITKPKKRYLADWRMPVAVVLFDGNKTNSKVDPCALKLTT